MKVLILDHHFAQDIDALLAGNHRRHVVRTLSPMVFAKVAMRMFPVEVFGAGLSRYHDAPLAEVRRRYRDRARELLFDLFRVFPFDVFVSPSDTFFYIRDAIDACHELGVQFAVVQKEAGVSVKALEQHAKEMHRWFPFAGDFMTTCSEKSREFWVSSGARPDQVTVAGQPRFDYYRHPERWPARGASDRPVVLFLSYDLDAYDEERALGGKHRPWERMHLETEEVLRNAAMSGAATVLLKPHPQHSAETLAGIERRLARVRNLTILSRGSDTRELIVTSDVVVGFQTTALAEAMAAGKRVVYTCWTDEVERALHLLLPFHQLGDCIDIADGPERLARLLCERSRTPSEQEQRARMTFVEDYLGPIDGRAAERVWRVIEQRVASAPRTTAHERTRADLLSDAATYARREGIRARRRALVRAAAATAAGFIGGTRAPLVNGLELRRDTECQRARECAEALAPALAPVGRLVGRDDENLLLAAWRLASRRLRQLLRGGAP